MQRDYLSKIKEFTLETLPDLDEVVLATLQFLTNFDLPTIDTETYSRPLVIGSGNAFRTGKILFNHADAVFANEGNYQKLLSQTEHIDAVYLISASGGKHATIIAEEVSTLDIPVFLITNNLHAPAAQFVREENVLLFPHIREPYTYNTSTYMSMMLAVGKSKPEEVLTFIESQVMPLIPGTFKNYNAFTFILPTKFDSLRGLFLTKFDELFGAKVCGRAFTVEQIKHAKTVVPSDNELFISFGAPNMLYGAENNRLFIPLPEPSGPAAMMAVGYYVIGHIQKQHPPYFKEHIAEYAQFASRVFGHPIEPIVE